MSNPDKEVSALQALLAAEKEGKNPQLDSELGLRRFVANADLIKTRLVSGKILDWGCGLGHMSFLLKQHQFSVTSYDVADSGRDFLSKIGQKLILADDAIKLPFPNAEFDAVLSSGVLEHVPQPDGSLQEIDRVLKPKGYLFIFRLPNKYSYLEFISDRLGRGDHAVKYTPKGIRTMLDRVGFEVLDLHYQGFLPYNLKGFPAVIRKIYHRFDALQSNLDSFLAILPLINMLCTNIELVARKK